MVYVLNVLLKATKEHFFVILWVDNPEVVRCRPGQELALLLDDTLVLNYDLYNKNSIAVNLISSMIKEGEFQHPMQLV